MQMKLIITRKVLHSLESENFWNSEMAYLKKERVKELGGAG